METVAEIIGDEAETKAVPRLEPPRHPDQPAFPTPGIYLNMSDAEYHAIHACSASGLKNLSVSSMDYWANSVLNREKQERFTENGKLTPMELGQAYHSFICEGGNVFSERYAVALDKEDCAVMAKKAGRRLCVTIADIRLAIDEAGAKPKGTSKDALIEQLLALDPMAMVWDRAVANHAKLHAGKMMISATLYRRIRIANAMIANDDQLKNAFSNGYPEVSIFWYDEQTGIPCKGKLDYLKMNHLIDLKSFGNKQRKPIQRAIDMAISYEKYFLAVAFYLEAIAAAKAMVRNTKGGSVFTGTGVIDPKTVEWFWKWAHQPDPECLWIFQQTGIAPVTRGRIMHQGSTLEVNRIAMRMLMKKWKKCAKTYGVDPWLDIEPVRSTVDEELTWAATDFGDLDGYEEEE